MGATSFVNVGVWVVSPHKVPANTKRIAHEKVPAGITENPLLDPDGFDVHKLALPELR
jgi:hypothetical protein